MQRWKADPVADIRDVLGMTAQVKKQMAAVEARLDQARRSAYLPTENTNSEDEEKAKSSINGTNSMERRRLHDRDRKFSTQSHYRRSTDYAGNNYHSTTYPDEYFSSSTLPMSIDQRQRQQQQQQSIFSKSDRVSPSISEQARVYTVGEILGTRPSVSSNFDLNLLRNSTTSRPRSALEHRRRHENIDDNDLVSRHGRHRVAISSENPLVQMRRSRTSISNDNLDRPLSIDAGNRSSANMENNRVSAINMGNNRLATNSDHRSINTTTRPRSIQTAIGVSKSVNIDKRSPINQGSINNTNSEIVIKKPRLFSHLKKRTSENGEKRSVSDSVDRILESKSNGAMAVDEKIKNGDEASSSSTTRENGDNRNRSSRSASKSESITDHSANNQEIAQLSSRRSSIISAFSSTSPPLKLEKESLIMEDQNEYRSDSSSIQSSTISDHRSEQQSIGSIRSAVIDNESSSDGETENGHSGTSSKSRGEKRKSSDDDEVSDEKVKSIQSPRKQQRRVISPTRKRSPSKKMENNSTTAAIIKKRNYDSEIIRSYMEKKRKERKSIKNDRDESIDKKRATHEYGQEAVLEFMKKKKVDEQRDRRRAAERMEKAKLEQKKRMDEILFEQKKRKSIPVAAMIGCEAVTTKLLDTRKKIAGAKSDDKEHYEKRVNAIRAKYNTTDHDSVPDAITNLTITRNEEILVNGNGSKSKGLDSRKAVEMANNENIQASTSGIVTNYDRPREPAKALVARPNRDTADVDEFNIINTILRKNPYLRVTTVYMPGVVNDTRLPRGNENGDVGRDFDSENGRSNSNPRSDRIEKRNEETNRIQRPKSIAVGKEKRTNTFGLRNGSADDDDGLSALLGSTLSEGGLSSVSSLTLSSKSDSIDRSIGEIERPRSSISRTEGDRRSPSDDRVEIEENGEASSRGSSARRASSGPSTSNLRLRAGATYMQALQYSVEQIEAAKEIGNYVLAEQNAAAANNLVEAQLAAQKWEQQIREVRMNADLQRYRAEIDRTAAAHELRMANEMTDNQRRLMETIMTTNRQLLEQQQQQQNQIRRGEDVAIVDRFLDQRSINDQRSIDSATKLAAEVAASAATAATLAALKRREKKKSKISSGSSSSATSSLSSAARTKSESGSSSRATTIVEEDREKTIAERSTDRDKRNNRSGGERASDQSDGNRFSDQSIKDESSIKEQTTGRSIRTESIDRSKLETSYSENFSTARDSSKKLSADSVIESIAMTERTASTLPEQLITESTSRSSQASPIRSEIGTQTKEISTAPSISSYKSVSTSVDEALRTESSNNRGSSSVATTTAETGTSDGTSTSGGTIKERRRSSENSDEASTSSTSSSTTKESVKLAATLRKHHHLDLDKLTAEDHFSFSMSDMSEHESRVQALRSNLGDRRLVAEKLKQEYKRRVKERLENTEKSLLNQLNAYDTYIENTEKQLKELERISTSSAASQSTRPATPPKILSPRVSSSETEIPSSPGRTRSSTSSPRSAKLFRSASNTSQKESGSTPVVSSEIEKRTTESIKTATVESPSWDKSESLASSASSTPRTVASNSNSGGVGGRDQKIAVDASAKIEEIVSATERQISTETVDEISEGLESTPDLSRQSSIGNSSRILDKKDADDKDGEKSDTEARKAIFKEKQEEETEKEMLDEVSFNIDDAEAKSGREKSKGSLEETSDIETKDEISEKLSPLDSEKSSASLSKIDRKTEPSNDQKTVFGEIDTIDQNLDKIDSADHFGIKSIDTADIGKNDRLLSVDQKIETQRQISDNPSEIETDQSITIPEVSDVSARSEKSSTSITNGRKSGTESRMSTAREDDHRLDEAGTKTSSRLSDSKSISIPTSPTESKVIEEEKNEISTKSKLESMKERGAKTTDLIVNAMVYDTIEHCLTSWRDHFRKLNSLVDIGDFGKSIPAEETIEMRKNRLADSIVDDAVTKILDEAIRATIFWNKRSSAKDEDGVISAERLENIRRLVSNIDDEKIKDVEDGSISAGSSPRSPRTPPSDRYNEAFRQPNKDNQEINKSISPKPIAAADDVDDEPNLALDDEEWMDDDFGLSANETDEKSKKSSGSTPRSARLDLSKFTTEIFSAIPCSRKSIDSIVNICVESLNDQRRMGEALLTSRKPRDLYVVGKDGDDSRELELSLNRESDRTYRDFIFDLCREIVDNIFEEDKNDEATNNQPKWRKPPRLRFSSYAKMRPRNLTELQKIVGQAVGANLDLRTVEEKNRKGNNSRQKLVSRRKLDRVDELLLSEIYDEEYDWTVYDREELKVKFQLADNIWKTVLDDCLDLATKKK